MNKKNMTLAIMSAVLATGLAMSVLGTNAPAFAQHSSSSTAATSNGTAGSAGHADENQASTAAAAGGGFTICFGGELVTPTTFTEGAECGTD
jgi:hypothetical protein